MKQTYILHEHHPRLLLFFAGWGADATPFKEYHPEDSDFMLCYDYRTLNFDTSLLAEYQEINVIGWSMGVWAASQVVPQLPINVVHSIAINGTPFPIDDNRGIPLSIFRGTLDGLTGASLNKFLRRMCADGAAFKAFLQITPRRPLEELREELEEIEKSYNRQMMDDERMSTSAFHWQQAIVGSNDRIIPPDNQLQAWTELGTPVQQTDDAHYQDSLFRHYLQDLWTND